MRCTIAWWHASLSFEFTGAPSKPLPCRTTQVLAACLLLPPEEIEGARSLDHAGRDLFAEEVAIYYTFICIVDMTGP